MILEAHMYDLVRARRCGMRPNVICCLGKHGPLGVLGMRRIEFSRDCEPSACGEKVFQYLRAFNSSSGNPFRGLECLENCVLGSRYILLLRFTRSHGPSFFVLLSHFIR